MEETRLYKKFAKITAQKTGIIVTHRVGLAKIADCIASSQFLNMFISNRSIEFYKELLAIYESF